MFCTYFLHKQHGQAFKGPFNNVGDTKCFHSFGKMSHVIYPYVTVLILLPCSVVHFLTVFFLNVFLAFGLNTEKYFVSIRFQSE